MRQSGRDTTNTADALRELDGLGQLRAFVEAGHRPPMNALMDIELVHIEPGLAIFEGEVIW